MVIALDIIFLAAVAIFVFWRLFSVLGSRTGTEKRFDPFAPKAATPKPELVKRGAATTTRATEPQPDYITKIKAADESFSPDDFIAGAKIAFEAIVEAYAKGDLKALKPLLGDAVYKSFASSINERLEKKQTQHTDLVAIREATIVDGSLVAKLARVTVRFVSDEINCTKDSEGRVVSGDPTRVERVTDVWVFERMVTSKDPNWFLVDTRAAG